MILTVAGLIRRKGVHHLLEAAARLRPTHDFSVVICGEGVEHERLQQLSDTLGLGDRTYFRGRVDRQAISQYFAACDVFVLASTLEAAGNVLLEAMARGASRRLHRVGRPCRIRARRRDRVRRPGGRRRRAGLARCATAARRSGDGRSPRRAGSSTGAGGLRLRADDRRHRAALSRRARGADAAGAARRRRGRRLPRETVTAI